MHTAAGARVDDAIEEDGGEDAGDDCACGVRGGRGRGVRVCERGGEEGVGGGGGKGRGEGCVRGG